MSDPYLGEIKMFAITYAPVHWAFCDGTELSIYQNGALYSLLIDQFGSTNHSFFLPNLRSRVPIHQDGAMWQGASGGNDEVALDLGEMPSHRHSAMGTSEYGYSFGAVTTIPAKAVNGATGNPIPFWTAPRNLVGMNENVLSKVGGGMHHENVQPSAVLLFCISMLGLYPPRP